MGSAPQRKVPKSIMILVPGVVLGIVLILIAVAWRSNTEERTQAEVPDAGDVEATVQAQNAVFLGCTDCHGDIDAVLLVGPRTPATKRGRSGVCADQPSAAARASVAAARFNSPASASIP